MLERWDAMVVARGVGEGKTKDSDLVTTVLRVLRADRAGAVPLEVRGEVGRKRRVVVGSSKKWRRRC